MTDEPTTEVEVVAAASNQADFEAIASIVQRLPLDRYLSPYRQFQPMVRTLGLQVHLHDQSVQIISSLAIVALTATFPGCVGLNEVSGSCPVTLSLKILPRDRNAPRFDWQVTILTGSGQLEARPCQRADWKLDLTDLGLIPVFRLLPPAGELPPEPLL